MGNETCQTSLSAYRSAEAEHLKTARQTVLERETYIRSLMPDNLKFVTGPGAKLDSSSLSQASALRFTHSELHSPTRSPESPL